MAKPITKKEKKRINLIKLIKQKTAELRDNIKRQKQKNAPFKILIICINKGQGNDIELFLNEKKIDNHILLFGYDYSQSLVMGALGISQVEKDVVLALADTKKTKNLLDDLNANFNLNSQSAGNYACILPPSSATLETVKMIIKNYKQQPTPQGVEV